MSAALVTSGALALEVDRPAFSASGARDANVDQPSQVSAVPQRDGVRISWSAVPGATGYQVYRQELGLDPVLVNPSPVPGLQLFDAGLESGTRYEWAVQAVIGSDTAAPTQAQTRSLRAAADSGGSGILSAAATAGDALAPYRDLMDATCPTATVTVSSTKGLVKALRTAAPGDSIHLADGVYRGGFSLQRSGSASKPIWLCGSRGAVLDAGSRSSGTALRLESVAHVRLSGFTVRDALQGVMVKETSDLLVDGLAVSDIGYEGIHLYAFTHHAVVQDNVITRTGSRDVAFGEGIYIGTSDRRWNVVTDGEPDTTHDVLVLRNRIVTAGAEPIEAKPGTSHGIIQDNTLSGHQPGSRAIGWVLVTGDDWLVRGNTGRDAVTNGYVLMRKDAWGQGNVVVNNHGTLNATGWGVLVQRPGSPVAPRTIIGCDNSISAVGAGLRTVDCQN